MARPTRSESIIRKIKKAKLEISERAAESMTDMYDVIESVAKNPKATDASRMAAAKYIIDEGNEYLEEMEENGDGQKGKPEKKDKDEGFFSKEAE